MACRLDVWKGASSTLALQPKVLHDPVGRLPDTEAAGLSGATQSVAIELPDRDGSNPTISSTHGYAEEAHSMKSIMLDNRHRMVPLVLPVRRD